MKAYGVNELRKMFLGFFESKGHLAMKSFSLVPHNDNSLLLINSETILYGSRKAAKNTCYNLPEMYPYRRY